jgi:hypothetical protein
MFPLFGFNLRSLRIVSQSAPSLEPILHGANVEVRPWRSADPEPVGRAGISYAIAIYDAMDRRPPADWFRHHEMPDWVA